MWTFENIQGGAKKMRSPKKNRNIFVTLRLFNLKFSGILENNILHLCAKFHFKILIRLKVIEVFVQRNTI